MRTYTYFLTLLFALALLAGCASPVETPTAAGQLTDEAVEAILADHPFLGDYTDLSPTPEDILEQINVDPQALEVLEEHIGDCISITTYQLSPSYVLTVDDNACSGYRVWIVNIEDL